MKFGSMLENTGGAKGAGRPPIPAAGLARVTLPARQGAVPQIPQWPATTSPPPTFSMFGLLNLDKPAGWSSRDAVNRVQRLVRPARVGHAGTLDPLATGVLVLCLGPATRLIEYVQRMPKTYLATFQLGRRSETDDTEGVVEEIPGCPVPSRAELDAALPQFVGEIQQRPPVFSAVKVEGQRAYKLARRGQLADLPPRPVTVSKLQATAYDYPSLQLLINCGSGTYVRSLGRDLAQALGTCAVMSSLQRTAIGAFDLSTAVDPRQLTTDLLPGVLISPRMAVADLPVWPINPAEARLLAQGRMLSVRDLGSLAEPPAAEYAALDAAGRLRAILRRTRGDLFKPAPNFPQS